MPPQHFLDISDHDAATLRGILNHAARMKVDWKAGRREAQSRLLAGLALTMIFEKPSTRTRVSFDLAMRQLGGQTLTLSHDELQLGRGETIADTARVLSRYADVILLRTGHHDHLQELARFSEVPVINGLTDRSHPCQVMADIMTFEEHRGAIEGSIVAWVGDGNNVARSWLHAAGLFDVRMRIASPAGFAPDPETLDCARKTGADIHLFEDPAKAVAGADCVITDTWVSMSDNDGKERRRDFMPYQVTEALLEKAAPDAIFMHCLPAHRGDEVTDAVIDGPRSVVWDEAENRLHVQKAILAWCLGGDE
ncbi:MAG: ornithine carbamoyltransferase [Hyphomicrobiales bacterium]|nr:ornithine carbamoyltransferase [Hyphomicrobiales bacterium]